MASRRLVRGARWVLAAALVTALPVAVAMIDDAFHRGEAARNVHLAGTPVGGLDAEALGREFDRLDADVASTPLRFAGPERSVQATMSDVGVAVDREATLRAVMAVGRDDGVVGDATGWWRRLRRPDDVAVTWTVDRAAATTWLGEHPEAFPIEPVEPTFSGAGGDLEVTPGHDGLALDVAAAVEALAAASGPGSLPSEVPAGWEPVPRRIDDEALAAAVAEAEALVSDDLTVYLNGRVASIGRGTVTRWIDAVDRGDHLEPVFDPGRAHGSVERLLAGLTDPGTPPTFAVDDGVVTMNLGDEPMRCCAEGAVDEMFDAAAGGHLRIAVLEPVPVYDDGGLAAAEALGVEELVSSFTTEHACCQSRVTNIHRIADLVRGQLVLPGERFSVNEFVGERTRDKGFVAAGVIAQGHFTDDVGGGISQFATTLFNAAFLAGLDFETYQSHSIYISRYPYGREATLSFPAPDLVVVNETPYAMLIWTEYTDTSITVQLYSTPYYEVEQSGQRRLGWGACTRVETYRTRTDPEGDVIEDEVFAIYRPGEGLDCAGNRTPEPRG